MSHIVQIQAQVRDPTAIAAACRRLGLAAPTYGTSRLFSGEQTGWQVQLLDWKYPVVCDLASGEVRYDNFGGRWGSQTQLEGFLQAYAVEKTLIEARRKGHSATEERLSDGSIKLTVNIGGAA